MGQHMSPHASSREGIWMPI